MNQPHSNSSGEEALRRVANVEEIIGGDPLAKPEPIPGMRDLLKGLTEKVTHKETGNDALHKRVSKIEKIIYMIMGGLVVLKLLDYVIPFLQTTHK